jgi:hypothetical protein
MPTLIVDGFTFNFSDHWRVSKPDEWSFYRNVFLKVFQNVKAVYILAIDSQDKTTWLIEVKDLRKHIGEYTDSYFEQSISLEKAIQLKVLHTLVMIIPAKINANEQNEKHIASKACQSNNLNVLLFLEQRNDRKPAYDLSSLAKKLRILLKPVDARLKVINSNNNVGPWTDCQIPNTNRPS